MPLARPLATMTAAAAAAALVLTGCSSTPATPSASETPATSAGQTLTVYVGRDEEMAAPLIERFEAEHGVTVEARYAGTTELEALLHEEGAATPAQVFWSQDAGALGALADKGLLAKLPEEITSTVPAELTSSDSTWVGITGRARVIAYDSERYAASDIPASVRDLTGDAWNGQVGFPPGNASFQSFVTAMRVLDGDEATEAWLAGMVGNNPVLTEKNGATLDLVNSGELGLGLINHYYWYERANELGKDNMRAQLAFLPGDAGGIVNVTGAAVTAGAADNANARAFVQFLLSEESQQYFVNETYEYPLVDGVAAPEGLPTLESLRIEGFDLGDLASLEETQRMLAAAGLL